MSNDWTASDAEISELMQKHESECYSSDSFLFGVFFFWCSFQPHDIVFISVCYQLSSHPSIVLLTLIISADHQNLLKAMKKV